MIKLSRRALLGVGATSLIMPSLPAFAAEKRIPQKPSFRVIADNDYAGDPDGLVALAHQLLTPKAKTVLVTVSALDARLKGLVPAGKSVATGKAIAQELEQRLGGAKPVVYGGSENLGSFEASPAARAIVAEAMRDDALPLLFTCGGPLTNLAAALKLEPKIAGRMKLIWIGGGSYPNGGWEYNLNADIAAARYIIEQSNIEIWQIPQASYRQMQYSVAGLYTNMRPISPFTRWLYERFTSLPDFINLGGTWPLGDTPMVLLGSVNSDSSVMQNVTARHINDDCTYGSEITGRTIGVWTQIDARLAFDDFFALLKVQALNAKTVKKAG